MVTNLRLKSLQNGSKSVAEGVDHGNGAKDLEGRIPFWGFL